MNKRLLEELGQSDQWLGACLEQLQQLQGEKLELERCVQALEAESVRLLGEQSVQVAVLGAALGQEAWQVAAGAHLSVSRPGWSGGPVLTLGEMACGQEVGQPLSQILRGKAQSPKP